MTAFEIFQSHMKTCEACQTAPMGSLCDTGRKLMGDIQSHVTMDIPDDDPDTEVVGRLFGMPVVKVKTIDLNRLYSRYCKHDPLCNGHMMMVAVNTMPFGISVGVTMWDSGQQDSGFVQGKRFIAPAEARVVFKALCTRAKALGYTEAWRGSTLFDMREAKAR